MYSLLTTEQLTKLEAKLRELMVKYGQVTHRTRAQFIAEWREFLKKEKITGDRYLDDLLRSMGK